MNAIIEWMIRNGVAPNLLLVFILIAGISSFATLAQKTFPESSLGTIRVSVEYTGATPAEVEEAIIRKIEERIESIEDIEEITGSAAEGRGTVSIELRRGADIAQKLDEIKAEIDRITSFPEDAERPEVTELTNRNRVIQIAIYGDVAERTLKELAYQVKDDLTAKQRISYVQVDAVRDYEISIKVSNDTLRAYNLTLHEIAGIIRRNSLDLPGGDIETSSQEILLRTKGQNYRQQDFENIVLLATTTGALVRLGDVAEIDDGFRDVKLSARYNNHPAAFVDVYTVGDEQVLKIVKTVERYLESELLPVLPVGVDAVLWRNDAKNLIDRLNLLIKNGSIGLLLVIMALTLFLDVRLAFWTSVGIFVSFIGAFAIMGLLGLSINQLSLFGFILAIGIVVDDAIVTGENIYAERERGSSPLQSAIKGTRRISLPVVFAVFTTIAAFLPLVLISGSLGNLLSDISVVVIAILSLSLIESLLILPRHLSHFETIHQSSTNPFLKHVTRLQDYFDNRLQAFVHGPLDRALYFVTRHYVITIIAGISLVMISVGFIAGGYIKFTFFPQIKGDYVIANIELEQGANIETTRAVTDYIYRQGREIAAAIQQRLDTSEPPVIKAIYTSLGMQGPQFGPGISSTLQSSQSNLASIVIELSDPELRSFTAKEFEQRWRERAGVIPDVRKLVFTSSQISLGDPIQIEISTKDEISRDQATDLIRHELEQLPGVFDIRDDRDQGKRELKLSLKPQARTFGVELDELAQQIRAAFFGAEALRIQRGREDVRVYVKLPQHERNSISDLENYRIRTRTGAFIPFHEIADIEYGNSPATILRRNGRRVITITADVDDAIITGQEVSSYLRAGVLTDLGHTIPGFSFSLAGEQREQARTIPQMIRNFLFAVFAIYALLAIAFHSYMQPLVIMSAIPFGFVGAIIGHLIMGMNLTLLSIFGIVGLSGVIINNSLVMINFINEELTNGKSQRQAIIDGAKGRFRPIMLTSLTTFLGISPLLLERSFQAQFLVPVAVSIGFGILFGTVILMLIVPALSMLPIFAPKADQSYSGEDSAGSADDIQSQ